MVGTGLAEMMPGMARFWHGYLEAARAAGEVRADLDVVRAAEWVMRIVVSLVTVPGGAVDTTDPRSVGRFLEEFLVTGLGPSPAAELTTCHWPEPHSSSWLGSAGCTSATHPSTKSCGASCGPTTTSC